MDANANKPINRMRRPGSVTVVSLFYGVNAVGLGAAGVVAGLTIVVPYFDGTLPQSQVSEDMSTIILFGGLLVGVISLAILTAVVASGLWQLKSWARRGAIIMSSLIIIVSLGVFVYELIKGQIVIPYGIVFHGLVLWALTSMSVKAVFAPMNTEPDMPISERGLEKELGVDLKTGMTCSNCGNAVLPKDKFCRKCGYALQ